MIAPIKLASFSWTLRPRNAVYRNNNAMNKSPLKQQLDTKELVFIQTVPTTINHITQTWQSCKTQPRASVISTLIRNLHHLGKQSAAADYLDITEITQALGETLSQTDTTAPVLEIHSEHKLDVLFSSLETAAHKIINKQSADNLPARRASDGQPLVLLMGDTESIIDDINNQLKRQGVRTRKADSIEQLLPLYESLNPAVVIIELAATSSGQDLAHIDQLKQQLKETAPTIVIVAEQDDIFSRLSAARLGVAAYFTHPLPITELVEFIYSKQNTTERSAYRVLIINDDATSAEQLLVELQKNAIKTCLLSYPDNVLASLIEFQPELILVDLHMRDTNGLELAANIRQHYAYSNTAIVFWAEEHVIDRHRHALTAAGEDFFSKAMGVTQFIAAIEVNLKRSRIIQDMMIRDGLTGLLNQTSLDECLQREVNKIKRHFSYVVIDLDHFSGVNQQFGYQVGDEVLKALAALFNRRLRAEDTAARFSGEKVALILPNTSANQARVLVGELLRKFSTFKFGVHKHEFSVTFSAGIAEFPSFSELSALLEAANQALYQAKTEGRNRVCLAICDSISHRGTVS